MKFSRREQDLLTASIDLVGRTGATSTEIRYSDDQQPVVWMAIASYPDGRWEVAAGQNPTRALYRLLERLVDGGICTHCQRPTGVDDTLSSMPLGAAVCWYQYDPELKTFRRGCEGDQ